MFKKGDRVTLVDATLAKGGKPNPNGDQSAAYASKKGLIGTVMFDVNEDGTSFASVAWDDGTLTSGYSWRFALYKPQSEWVLAPEGYEFEVGQEVKIGELISERENGFPIYVGISHEMPAWEGKTVHIFSVRASGSISISEDHGAWAWNPRWFLIRNLDAAPKPQYQKGDEVVVVKNAIIKGGPKWIEEQDACLNEEGIITAIDEKAKVKVYQIKTASGEWWYCEEAFQKLAAFIKAGGKIKRNDAAIQEKLNKAVDNWVKKAHKEAGMSCCSFAVFLLGANGQIITRNEMQAPCHAGLHLYDKPLDVIGAVDFPCFGAAKKDEDWDVYADYIINRSPFKIGFIPTPVAEVRENGVRLNIDATADQVAGACVALRHGTEHPGHMKQFVWLVKQGIDEDAAWVSAFMVQPIAGTNYEKFMKAQVGGGHQVICGGMPEGVIFKFMRHGYPDLKRKPYKNATKYEINGGIGYDAYRKGGVTDSITAFTTKHLKTKTEGNGWAQEVKITKDAVLEYTKSIHEQIQKA